MVAVAAPAKVKSLEQPVLLPYQQRWVSDASPIKVWSKSRRIGASWAEACLSVLEASKAQGGRNTLYVSYNLDSTQTFIRDCEAWAASFSLAFKTSVIENPEKDVLTFLIRFASGKTIKALSGKAKNIRGKQARVVIDEAAFCEDLDQLLKAATALSMWGSQISVISSHNGEENPFNKVCLAIESGEKDWSLHVTPLDEALDEGLYQRICLTQGVEWSEQKESEWRAELIDNYGISADEELFCVPFAAAAGKVFDRTWFEIIDEPPELDTSCIECRFWDLAATERELRKDACFTSGVKIRLQNGLYTVLDVVTEQVSPAAANDLILSTARLDGRGCIIRWELEGGSAGLRDEFQIQQILMGFDASAVRPLGDKVTRAKPFASEAKRGNVKVLRGGWNANYLGWLSAFPDGKIKDPVDASSGCYAELSQWGGTIQFASTGKKRSSAGASWR
jgi:predicted phage terminase large subunit-like protein